MSQSSENTWSATDAKESQQEIAKLVGKLFGCIFFLNCHFVLRHTKMDALVGYINSLNFFEHSFRWTICH